MLGMWSFHKIYIYVARPLEDVMLIYYFTLKKKQTNKTKQDKTNKNNNNKQNIP